MPVLKIPRTKNQEPLSAATQEINQKYKIRKSKSFIVIPFFLRFVFLVFNLKFIWSLFLEFCFLYLNLFNKEQNVEVSDTTKHHSSTKVRPKEMNKKILLLFYRNHF